MGSYTFAEYADMHLVYGEAGQSNVQARILYAERFPNRRIPHRRTFANVDRRLRETGSFIPRSRNERIQATNVNLEETVLDIARQANTISTRRISAILGVNHMLVWRILSQNGLYPYHYQPVQALEEQDFIARLSFCQWIQQREPELSRYILFTDESTFTRDGMMNMHNMHIWQTENPHQILIRHHQRNFKINVWCGIIGDILLGPIRLPDNLNGATYLNFLRNDLEELLDEFVPLNIRRNMYFMQDGAPPHYSIEVRNYLNENYSNRWIGRAGPVAWPPRSPDTTLLDFFL